ncbi:glycosyltransferase [Aliiglaciecola sp. LCG003]|uniref:glycosyltransferase n=1 Tax=Aliiglaciecola sp. LCG003 TaxID=3053655 RepID=UPI002573004E|nr:glycosyltransferase [Aliiglaciecola sp. LCG003]WJG09744.1 glycosyltransferase [Aliiglaciecola sp. LCG003]
MTNRTEAEFQKPTSLGKRQLRILHLIHNLDREGAQVVLKNIVTSTESNRSNHVVCAWKRGGPIQDDLEKLGVKVFVASQIAKTTRKKAILSAIRQIIISQHIDVIHAHMSDSLFLAAMLTNPIINGSFRLTGGRLNTPVVATHHSNKLTPSTGLEAFFWYILLFWSARAASKHVAISVSVYQQLKSKLLLVDNKMSVVNNGVPIPSAEDIEMAEVAAQNNSKVNIDGSPILVLVGRLVALKGIKQLISASALLLESFPKLNIYIVGEGPLRAELEGQINNLGLLDHVHLVGASDNIPMWLSTADLFVSTSHYEGIPMGILEAMAWKVPVVASNVPGSRDIVQEQSTGLLYPLHDVNGLVEKIIWGLNNRHQLRQYAETAFDIASNKFSTLTMNNSYQDVYIEVLNHE